MCSRPQFTNHDGDEKKILLKLRTMKKIRQYKSKQPKLEPPAKAPETISNRIEWPKTESSTQNIQNKFQNENYQKPVRRTKCLFEGFGVLAKHYKDIKVQ